MSSSLQSVTEIEKSGRHRLLTAPKLLLHLGSRDRDIFIPHSYFCSPLHHVIPVPVPCPCLMSLTPAFWSFLSHAQSFQRAGTWALDAGTLLWVSTSVYSFKACSCFRHSCVALQKLLLSRIQRNCFMLLSLGHLCGKGFLKVSFSKNKTKKLFPPPRPWLLTSASWSSDWVLPSQCISLHFYKKWAHSSIWASFFLKKICIFFRPFKKL